MNITCEKKGHTEIITIDRPDALNALNIDVLEELEQAVIRAEKDEEVRVIIITGAGRAFVAGADIQQMQNLTPVEARAFGEFGNSVFSKIESLAKPVIAAINGFALGGGCELAMSCDIRLAGSKAKFGQPEVGLGITPGFGGTQRLPRIVGASKAKELIFTGQTIDAEEALRIGLVSTVVPNEELIETALNMADMISKNSQIAVRQSKYAINKGLQCDIKTGTELEAQAFALCFSDDDHKNAMDAFVNKRKRA